MFVDGKAIFKFKSDNKNEGFPTKFCLGNIPEKFDVDESGEV